MQGLVKGDTARMLCQITEPNNLRGKLTYSEPREVSACFSVILETPTQEFSASESDIPYFSGTFEGKYVPERYKYDPYGKRHVMTAGFVPVEDSAIGQEYGYTGRRHDSESGMMYFRARYYSDALGRFVSRDPYDGIDKIGNANEQVYAMLGRTYHFDYSQFDEFYIGNSYHAGIRYAQLMNEIYRIFNDRDYLLANFSTAEEAEEYLLSVAYELAILEQKMSVPLNYYDGMNLYAGYFVPMLFDPLGLSVLEGMMQDLGSGMMGGAAGLGAAALGVGTGGAFFIGIGVAVGVNAIWNWARDSGC